jgi:response regulator RpfG family c-di-GMP phosphodiesterase
MTDEKNSAEIQKLQRAIVENSLAYDSILEAFACAMDLREMEPNGHIHRVTELTVRLAAAIGVNNTETLQIKHGAFLHDIGKMGIPDTILQKPGALNDEEMQMVRKHPQIAYDLLSRSPYLHFVLDIPYRHHEKWDGSGYPNSLKMEQIPLAARVFAVVDVYALSSSRPYRPAWPKAKVVEHLKAESGKHFDPVVLEAFLKLKDKD